MTSFSNHLLPAFGPQGLVLFSDGPERRIPPVSTHLRINEGCGEGEWPGALTGSLISTLTGTYKANVLVSGVRTV